jgi:mRNA interferase YafQ
MRTPEYTGQFKRDYKREKKGRHAATLESDLGEVLLALLSGQSLEPRHRDHALIGEWRDYRDCHVKPDLVLIYLIPDEVSLRLVRLGSHSQLGL